MIYEKIDEYERNISQKDYSELVEKITIEFLENIRSDLRNLPPPKSKSEIEFQKRLIEERISQLSSLDEAVRLKCSPKTGQGNKVRNGLP